MTVPAPRLHDDAAVAAVGECCVVLRHLLGGVEPGRSVKPSSTVPLQSLSLPSQTSVAGVGRRADVLAAVGRVAVEIDVAGLAAVRLAGRHAAVEAAHALAERVR